MRFMCDWFDYFNRVRGAAMIELLERLEPHHARKVIGASLLAFWFAVGTLVYIAI